MSGKQGRSGAVVRDDLRAFLAVARAGTLSGAARQLGLGLATVSRRMDRLEAAVGQPLFLRAQSGYLLTEDGRALVERAEETEAAARAVTSGEAGPPELSGRVRLATAENLATALILPALPALRARHPRLSVDLVTDIRTLNLHRREADLALRMVRPERGNVSLQRLGTLGYGLYGAPGLTDGGAAEIIGWDAPHADLPAARWAARRLQGRGPSLTTSSLATQLAACVAGLGLAVLPHLLARPRGLVCLERDLGVDQPIWLAIQSDLARSRRVRAVADLCRATVQSHRDALEGNGPEAS